jgi:putative transposase
MSSSRHPETDGPTDRVKITFERLVRCLCCYDGTNSTDLLPQVEFAYNATRALGIKHTPLHASFGFSHEEPHELLFSMRPSIPVSQGASERLRLLH